MEYDNEYAEDDTYDENVEDFADDATAGNITAMEEYVTDDTIAEGIVESDEQETDDYIETEDACDIASFAV